MRRWIQSHKLQDDRRRLIDRRRGRYLKRIPSPGRKGREEIRRSGQNKSMEEDSRKVRQETNVHQSPPHRRRGRSAKRSAVKTLTRNAGTAHGRAVGRTRQRPDTTSSFSRHHCRTGVLVSELLAVCGQLVPLCGNALGDRATHVFTRVGLDSTKETLVLRQENSFSICRVLIIFSALNSATGAARLVRVGSPSPDSQRNVASVSRPGCATYCIPMFMPKPTCGGK